MLADPERVLEGTGKVLPRASDLWIQASLEQRQRLQRLFFPEGVAFSGKAFEYLRPIQGSNKNLVDQKPMTAPPRL